MTDDELRKMLVVISGSYPEKETARNRLSIVAPDLAAEVLRLRESEAALRAEVGKLRDAFGVIESQLQDTGEFIESAWNHLANIITSLADKDASHDR